MQNGNKVLYGWMDGWYGTVELIQLQFFHTAYGAQFKMVIVIYIRHQTKTQTRLVLIHAKHLKCNRYFFF